MSMKILKEVLEGALKDEGVVVTNAQAELQTFYQRIEVPFNEAMAAGDAMSLGTFRDRLAMLLGRASFKVLNRNRAIAMTAAMTVVRVLAMAVK